MGLNPSALNSSLDAAHRLADAGLVFQSGQKHMAVAMVAKADAGRGHRLSPSPAAGLARLQRTELAVGLGDAGPDVLARVVTHPASLHEGLGRNTVAAALVLGSNGAHWAWSPPPARQSRPPAAGEGCRSRGSS